MFLEVEKSLRKQPTKNLTFSQWELLGASIANAVNGRPLFLSQRGVTRAGDGGPLLAICPNDLIIGRPSTESLFRFGTKGNLSDTYNLVVKIRDSWWRDWSLVAPEVLYRRSKWTTPIRDWKIGDVVYYSANQKIGDYQLAKIVECISEPDNLVRSVIVEYTSGKNNKKRTRPVSTASLILIAPTGYTLNEVGEYSPSFHQAWEEDTMAEGRIKDLEKQGKIPPN